MAFDLERFMRDAGTLSAPTAKIPVPDLAHWFEKGEEAVWEVKGLTGEEWARANDITGRLDMYRAVSRRWPAKFGRVRPKLLKP